LWNFTLQYEFISNLRFNFSKGCCRRSKYWGTLRCVDW